MHLRGPATSSPLLARLGRDLFVVVAVAFVALRLFAVEPWDRAIDALAYWSTRDGILYDGAMAGELGAYLYSPAFAQLLAPLTSLPWAPFLAIWTAGLAAALWWLGRRWSLVLLLFLPIAADIATGNIHLWFAVAIVAGFRWPVAWALLVLTKVTPGIGLLWFAVRGEWRHLAIAIGATAGIAIVSYVLDPGAWRTWLEVLAGSSGTPEGTPGWFLPVALPIRLVAAAIIVVVAARTDRAWLLPAGVVLALPIVWFNGLAVLAASIPLLRDRTVADERARSVTPAPTIAAIP